MESLGPLKGLFPFYSKTLDKSMCALIPWTCFPGTLGALSFANRATTQSRSTRGGMGDGKRVLMKCHEQKNNL